MEKFKNIPLILFCLYGAKSLIILPQLNEVLVLSLLCLISAFLEYKLQDKKSQEIKKELEDLKKEIKDQSNNLSTLKDSVSSIKMAQAYKAGAR